VVTVDVFPDIKGSNLSSLNESYSAFAIITKSISRIFPNRNE